MPFLGVGFTPNTPIIDDQRKFCLWTFWLEGTAPDGSKVILIGSADNLLSVDATAFGDLDILRPGFNYPSSTDGLTSLIQAVFPGLRTRVPDEEWDHMTLDEADVAAFALGLPSIAEEEEDFYDEVLADDDDEYGEVDESGRMIIELGRWPRRSGTVHGLARVYASALGREVKRALGGSRFEWLPDDAKVVVGAPYALDVGQSGP